MKSHERGPRPRIDWQAARRRLAELDSRAAASRSAEQILATRAARLAVPLSDATERGQWLELLTFRAGSREYAIESRWVLEVTKSGRLSRVPGADPVLLGICGLRGDLLPVFDVGLLLEGVTTERSLVPHLIVLGQREPDFGILVDAVEGVVRLSESSLTSGAVLGALPHPEQLRGITQDGRVVLDGDAMLRDRRIFVATTPSSTELEKE